MRPFFCCPKKVRHPHDIDESTPSKLHAWYPYVGICGCGMFCDLATWTQHTKEVFGR